MELKDEKDYLKRLSGGDMTAFHYFYQNCFPKTKFFIAHIVKSEEDAENLAQDIFEKIWKNRESLSALECFDSYLFEMARNAALNYIDRKAVEISYFTKHRLNAEELERGKKIDEKEMEMLAYLEVERMPEQKKRIFNMSRLGNLKNEKIAKVLNLSKRTVEKHISMAIKQIREKNFFYNIFYKK